MENNNNTSELHQLEQDKQALQKQLQPLQDALQQSQRDVLRLQHKLDIEQNRKINRLLGGIKKLHSKDTRNEGIHSILTSYRSIKAPAPAHLSSSNKASKTAQLTTASHAVSKSKLPYPNLRIISTGPIPSYSDCFQPVIVDESWRDTLRPELPSSDAVIIELPNLDKENYPTDVATELIQAANELSVPTAVIVSSDKQLDLDITDEASSIGTADANIYQKAIKKYGEKKTFFINKAIDITTYNPISWMYEPTEIGCTLIGLSSPNAKDSAVIKQAKKYITIKEVYAKQPIKGLGKPHFYAVSDISNDIIQKTKQFQAVICLPSMFNDAADYKNTLLQILATGSHVLTTDQATVKQLDAPHLHLLSEDFDASTITDPDQRERRSVQGRRKILDASSVFAKTDDLVEKLSIKTDFPRKISVIMSTNRPDYIDHAIDNVRRQSYPDKELVLILHGEGFDKKAIKKSLDGSGLDYKLLNCPADMIFGEVLNHGLDNSTGYYVTKFDDDDHYGQHHLKDLVHAMHYSEADVVGKWGHFVYLEASKELLAFELQRQERYGGHLPGGTFLIRKSTLLEYRFGRVERAIDSELWDRLKANGAILYSTNRYNYVRVRHGDNTWQEKDDFFKARAEKHILRDAAHSQGFA